MIKTKMMLRMVFSGDRIRPMVDYRFVAESENILHPFLESQPMLETLLEKKEKREASLFAEASVKSQEISVNRSGRSNQHSRKYTLTYFNPELGKTEVLEESNVVVDDIAERVIEESTGAGSIYSIYSFVAQPLVRRKIVPWKLKKILDEREYGTPPTFGSAAMVSVARSEKKKREAAEIIKCEKKAVEKSIVRIEKCEKKLEKEIPVFQEVFSAVKSGKSLKSSLDKLPPLSRARYLAALKKKFSRKEILNFLLKDLSFLKAAERKLELFTVEDLVNILKLIKKTEEE